MSPQSKIQITSQYEIILGYKKTLEIAEKTIEIQKALIAKLLAERNHVLQYHRLN